MSELDQLRQEAEQLKNQIRVSSSLSWLVLFKIQMDILSIAFCAPETDI